MDGLSFSLSHDAPFLDVQSTAAGVAIQLGFHVTPNDLRTLALDVAEVAENSQTNDGVIVTEDADSNSTLKIVGGEVLVQHGGVRMHWIITKASQNEICKTLTEFASRLESRGNIFDARIIQPPQGNA